MHWNNVTTLSMRIILFKASQNKYGVNCSELSWHLSIFILQKTAASKTIWWSSRTTTLVISIVWNNSLSQLSLTTLFSMSTPIDIPNNIGSQSHCDWNCIPTGSKGSCPDHTEISVQFQRWNWRCWGMVDARSGSCEQALVSWFISSRIIRRNSTTDFQNWSVTQLEEMPLNECKQNSDQVCTDLPD